MSINLTLTLNVYNNNMTDYYQINDPDQYQGSQIAHVSDLSKLYKIIGCTPYGYSLTKCVVYEKFKLLDTTDDSIYIAHTSCYDYIITHIVSRQMIQTTIYGKHFTSVVSLINQISDFPQYIWNLINHKIPPFNETAYQISGLLIGFYCDHDGDYQVHGHQVSINTLGGNIECDECGYDHWSRAIFYNMMYLKKQWV